VPVQSVGAPSSPYTVLAVDDDPAIIDIVTKYLARQNIRVISTTDPEMVPALIAQEHPRLIISDIAMPGMTGLQLLQKLKADPATQEIPFILLTSSRTGDDVREGLDSGAEAYLVKPLDWEQSWPKIQAILLRS
jgi:DNA-binding response OmpR family regulator